MKRCQHCAQTLFTEVYDTCMTCFEKHHAYDESSMTKPIGYYQQDSLWDQNEIKRLESCCSNLHAVVKGDAYNIKRLSEENERLVKIYNDQREILDKILFELPVGNVTTHTYENIPERVKYYVREHALLESNQDEANELIAQSMPNFFDHPSAGYILDNTALLIGIADKAKIEAWADREDLESLERSIKTHYEYYSGFAADKNLSSFQMLDALFKSTLMGNHVYTKENECLVNDNGKAESGARRFQSVSQMLDYLHPEIRSNQAEESARYKAALDENEYLLEQLEALKDKSRLFKSAQDGQEYLRCLHQEGDKHQSVGLWILDCLSYKESLEEIIKRPRKSETCRLIAQKALGLLSDDEYQPELLIEENLKLKMKIEDLESLIIDNALNKIYPEKVNTLMCCEDCGEYWDYHHEQHCKANL